MGTALTKEQILDYVMSGCEEEVKQIHGALQEKRREMNATASNKEKTHRELLALPNKVHYCAMKLYGRNCWSDKVFCMWFANRYKTLLVPSKV